MTQCVHIYIYMYVYESVMLMDSEHGQWPQALQYIFVRGGTTVGIGTRKCSKCKVLCKQSNTIWLYAAVSM